MTSLVERLGYPAGSRVLLVTADDLGLSHAANAGVYDALRRGLVTSAGLMVPCAWAREAASRYRGEDIGVHLAVNSEHDRYRWGPITHAPSLLDGDGGFPRTLADLWDHADVDEVRRECRAQVERAVWWGFDVTHLSVHKDALSLRPEFFDVVLDLAVEFRLPLRLPPGPAEASAGFPMRVLTAEQGVLGPDRVVGVRAMAVGGARRALETVLLDAVPGVTEIVVHPAIDTPELRALSDDWAARVDDHDLVTTDGALAGLVRRAGVVLSGYRELRQVMRDE
jgi:hypothetical protein